MKHFEVRFYYHNDPHEFVTKVEASTPSMALVEAEIKAEKYGIWEKPFSTETHVLNTHNNESTIGKA